MYVLSSGVKGLRLIVYSVPPQTKPRIDTCASLHRAIVDTIDTYNLKGTEEKFEKVTKTFETSRRPDKAVV